MKLNITPKELLALYNVLYDRFDGPQGRDTCEYKTDDPAASDAVQLKQVYGRLKAILIAGLANPSKQLDPLDSWLANEGEKVDALVAQNEELKEIAKDPTKLVKQVNLADILADDENEVPKELGYPARRKGPPPPKNSPFQAGKRKAHWARK